MDLLLIKDGNKSQCVYIKGFNRFMYNKTKCKSKKHFCKYCLQSFSSERDLVKHIDTCLNINGKQTVKLRSSSIKFKNYFKQLAVSFKIYAYFECIVKRVKSTDRGDRDDNALYTEIFRKHIPCSFAYKVVCIDDEFSKTVVLYRGKNTVNKFIKAILKEYEYCKKVMKKYFNKNLVMPAEDEERFQSSNKC